MCVVDLFNHGEIKISVNHTTHYLAFDHRTGFFAVTPDPSRNDSVTVRSMRYPGCGTGEVGWYFRAGAATALA